MKHIVQITETIDMLEAAAYHLGYDVCGNNWSTRPFNASQEEIEGTM